MAYSRQMIDNFYYELECLEEFLDAYGFANTFTDVYEKRCRDLENGGTIQYNVQVRREELFFRAQIAGYGSPEIPDGLDATKDVRSAEEVRDFFADYSFFRFAG